MAKPSILLDDVRFGYRGREVLHGVSWSVPTGFVGLLGPNGAGKTTLINLLVGLRSAQSGTVALSGGAVGYVPQRAGAPGHMRVRDVIEYAAWLQGVPNGELGAACASVVALMGLDGFERRRFRTLSGGERQRVAIAAAVSHRPSLLVLDEPTAGLDPSHRLSVRRAIRGLEHLDCVLVSTHLLEDVEHLCDRVGVLADGQIRFTGSVDELLARAPDTAETDYGSAFEAAYEQLVNGPEATP